MKIDSVTKENFYIFHSSIQQLRIMKLFCWIAFDKQLFIYCISLTIDQS